MVVRTVLDKCALGWDPSHSYGSCAALLIRAILFYLIFASMDASGQQGQVNPAGIRSQYQSLVSETLRQVRRTDPEAENQLRQLAERAAIEAEAAARAGDVDKVRLIERNLDILLSETLDNKEEIGGFLGIGEETRVTANSIAIALRTICPLYPFC